jgi:4-hydroxybenzoate polyprenyltransferase
VYSLVLKDFAVVDAAALTCGYSLRVYAGGLAVNVTVAPWLLVCSSSMFFGLALLKRYGELINAGSGEGPESRVRGYSNSDANIVAGIGISAGCIAVVLLALYPFVVPSAHDRWPLWLASVYILLWMAHLWLTAHRGGIRDDPLAFSLRDPSSRMWGVLTAAALLVAA